MTNTVQVHRVYIKATPERIWEAITKPEWTAKYGYTGLADFDLKVGGKHRTRPTQEFIDAGFTGDLVDGEVLEVDPPRKLVQSFNAVWGDDVKAEGTSRVTWAIEPVGDSCCLTVTHDQLGENANPQLYGGWPMILSGLKTLLETGEKLTTPGSLMYDRGWN